jgi:YHS domain-containing protein
MMTDPVCGMQVDEKRANLKAEYEGRTYYFCSDNCKRTFMQSPEKYTKEKQRRT